jgi:hypothetical protein
MHFCAQAAKSTEAESKEKHGVWDPMPELTITSPYVNSRVDSNTFTMGIGQPYARVDFDPMPKLTLFPSQGLWIWPRDYKGGRGGVTYTLDHLNKTSPFTYCTNYAPFSAVQSNPRTAVYIVVVVIGILIIATIVTLTGITDRLAFPPLPIEEGTGQ